MQSLYTVCSMAFLLLAASSQAQDNPSFEEVLSLRSVSNPEISPDGKHVLFQLATTDWDNNRYDREIWISKKDEPEVYQLTNNLSSSSYDHQWSPDGMWISFITTVDDKTQIHVMRTVGGAAFQVTDTDKGVNNHKWSPDGNQIAFLQSEDQSKKDDQRKEKYGSFSTEDKEYKKSQLWVLDFKPEHLNLFQLPVQKDDSTFQASLMPTMLLDSVDFTINNYKYAPNGKMLAIEHQPNPLINSFFDADISIYNLETKALTSLVANASYDGIIDWSPDGSKILYQSSLDNRTSNYYANGHLLSIDIDGSNVKTLGADIDEDISNVTWTSAGIFATVLKKTKRELVKIDVNGGASKVLPISLERVFDYSISKNGIDMVVSGTGDDDLTEIYRTKLSDIRLNKITAQTDQIENWATAKSEVISWTSTDGALIEGILHKPQDYDPSKKYPLMVIIHGGPTGISTPSPTPSYVYPMVQWLNKGALILRPNYRGSAGYGEAFRSLNVKNLGVGDAWDVLSGVEHLEKSGIIDGDKVASMGWSQGGYISAFLTTNSNKFKAISVGAGISNWMTYYVNTDIHPFTRQYLKATPWSDKEIYEKTSPMTNINKASTPTLIQHGEFDRRVPIANAYELYQGLQDVGVDTELIIYKGFGHGISKPKERLAATWHNWIWMAKYIWGEDIELPKD